MALMSIMIASMNLLQWLRLDTVGLWVRWMSGEQRKQWSHHLPNHFWQSTILVWFCINVALRPEAWACSACLCQPACVYLFVGLCAYSHVACVMVSVCVCAHGSLSSSPPLVWIKYVLSPWNVFQSCEPLSLLWPSSFSGIEHECHKTLVPVTMWNPEDTGQDL